MMETKRRILLDHSTLDDDGSRNFYPADAPTPWITLTAQDWEDMGKPLTLTVTIRSGDRLNP